MRIITNYPSQNMFIRSVLSSLLFIGASLIGSPTPAYAARPEIGTGSMGSDASSGGTRERKANQYQQPYGGYQDSSRNFYVPPDVQRRGKANKSTPKNPTESRTVIDLRGATQSAKQGGRNHFGRGTQSR